MEETNNYKIYKYTNVINNKVYIGQTKRSLYERAQKNGRNYCESRLFYNAIKKYGWDNFVPEIIVDGLSKEQANEMEKYYIQEYNSADRNFGYNIELGGDNSEMSDVSKKIISEKAKERYKDKTKNPMYGKTHTVDSIDKMRKIKLGSNNPMYGKHLTEEAKKKQRDTYIKNGSSHSYIWTDDQRMRKSVQQKEICKLYINKKVRCIEDDTVFEKMSDAAEYYNVSISTLSGHLHNYQKTCKGKHFEFVS